MQKHGMVLGLCVTFLKEKEVLRMKESNVISVLSREMRAIGDGWRINWSDFDGRQLQYQLHALAKWGEDAMTETETESDYAEGSAFLAQREK